MVDVRREQIRNVSSTGNETGNGGGGWQEIGEGGVKPLAIDFLPDPTTKPMA